MTQGDGGLWVLVVEPVQVGGQDFEDQVVVVDALASGVRVILAVSVRVLAMSCSSAAAVATPWLGSSLSHWYTVHATSALCTMRPLG